MGSVARVCSVAGIAGLTAVSWTAVAWTFWPLVEGTVSFVHQTYGY